MNRPAIAFAMRAERTQHVFTPELLLRLGGMARILDDEPMTGFDGQRARRLLAEAEVLVTGWGAPLFDEVALSSAPRLRFIMHAAGTVKGVVDDCVFDAGVTVSHAAAANAMPVAEFTLAAIIFAGKQVFQFRNLYAADRGRGRSERLLGLLSAITAAASALSAPRGSAGE